MLQIRQIVELKSWTISRKERGKLEMCGVDFNVSLDKSPDPSPLQTSCPAHDDGAPADKISVATKPSVFSACFAGVVSLSNATERACKS